jgi:hypothetical protein
MFFRAAFWIALVAVFIPHEPDLGLGRPGFQGFLAGKMANLVPAGLKSQAGLCKGDCSLPSSGDLRSYILASLARVKAELKAASRARDGGKDAIADEIAKD